MKLLHKTLFVVTLLLSPKLYSPIAGAHPISPEMARPVVNWAHTSVAQMNEINEEIKQQTKIANQHKPISDPYNEYGDNGSLMFGVEQNPHTYYQATSNLKALQKTMVNGHNKLIAPNATNVLASQGLQINADPVIKDGKTVSYTNYRVEEIPTKKTSH